PWPQNVKAKAVDPETGQASAVVSKYFDISKKNWKVIAVSTGAMTDSDNMIDEDPDTFWASDQDADQLAEVTVDLGKEYNLKGFTYWPIQERWSFGIITDYEFYVSKDGRSWQAVASGEFSNVINNPVEQKIQFRPVAGRFIKLKAVKVKGDDLRTSFGEIGVITAQ
ncbi:MAG: discoidin domain-containing protein, partial [Flavobacteriaceae bacterium]